MTMMMSTTTTTTTTMMMMMMMMMMSVISSIEHERCMYARSSVVVIGIGDPAELTHTHTHTHTRPRRCGPGCKSGARGCSQTPPRSPCSWDGHEHVRGLVRLTLRGTGGSFAHLCKTRCVLSATVVDSGCFHRDSGLSLLHTNTQQRTTPTQNPSRC
jgi:hypothetical protein